MTYQIEEEFVVDKEPWVDHFICPICMNITEDPLVCNTCDKKFCRLCVNQFRAKSDICPCCKQFWVAKNLDRTLKEILNNLQIGCIFKCGYQSNYKEALLHIRSCPHRRIFCPAVGCKHISSMLSINLHLETCEKARRTCYYKCYGCPKIKNNIPSLDHHSSRCNYKPNKCIGCKKYYLKRDIGKHKSFCGDIEKACKNCQCIVKRREIKAHNCFQHLMTILNTNVEKFWGYKTELITFYKSM